MYFIYARKCVPGRTPNHGVGGSNPFVDASGVRPAHKKRASFPGAFCLLSVFTGAVQFKSLSFFWLILEKSIYRLSTNRIINYFPRLKALYRITISAVQYDWRFHTAAKILWSQCPHLVPLCKNKAQIRSI